ncbi:hypothetical protein PANT_14c00063 [Moesziomyces antarcticus T-34]|uniref:YMC020W-like alpha/beta hydrolase domain-containing protein n=1 Tax=Pseudozyma antarctica (strain T-34) TaxID=1151754 RepID=M9M465_PSEA3|nr:hypothetical protein PANT_14c00063 [Moesziomyces antarcticus T-34]
MPFSWTTDRAAAPPNASAAPSGRISASPQTRPSGHRRGLPHSSSISSRHSIVSTEARTAAALAAPHSLSVPKSASSAALTSTDESDDFRRFLDEAHANDQAARSLGAHPPQRAAAGAAESLRRVTSSSTLNSMHDQRVAQPARPATSAAPVGRVRKNSTLSTASRAQRSVSNYSMNFRNPTSQFLENLSAEAQTPELGIDDTPVAGRAVDNKSHLTALGHAAQLQTRTASGSHSTKISSAKGKAPAHQLPVRSSTVPIATATPSPSVRIKPSVSGNVAASASASGSGSARSPPSNQTSQSPGTSPTARLSPLSPRRRPQSYIHKPPSEPSGVVSPRRLGESRLGHGLPAASPIQAKRSADEMERSSSLQPTSQPSEQPQAAIPASPSQASRRKTWFGLGWAADDVRAPAAADKPNLEAAEAAEAAGSASEQPPPPMSEEEAAFRRSLGYNDVYDPAADKQPSAGGDAEQKPFPAGRDSDATIRAAHIPTRDRRISWIPWRNASATAEQGSKDAASSSADTPAHQVQQPQPDASASKTEAPVTSEASESVGTQEMRSSASRQDGQDTVTYKTVVKRGWMGARYEVQEPVPSLQHAFDPPQVKDDTDLAAASSETMEQVTDAAAAQDFSAYPPASTNASDSRQTSGTWRWRFWSGADGSTYGDQAPAAQELVVSSEPPPTDPAGSTRVATEPDTAEPMDIDQNGPPDDAPHNADSASWTYSSYVSRWVPTWVYNAQQQDSATKDVEGPSDRTSEAVADKANTIDAAAQARTPAEQVKAEALARDASVVPFTPSKVVLNNSTKSGWINFFGSRSANLPREAPEAIGNNDGVEVMDISDMDAPAQSTFARDVALRNGRLTPDVSRAPRARTVTGGSLAGSKASSFASESDMQRAATPLSTSKDSVRNLSKAAITKAANVTAASTLGLGKGKRTDAPTSTATASGIGEPSGGSQASKDAGKGLAPNGSGPSRSGASTPTKSVADPVSAPPPNLVLPSFDDTFTRAPRMWPPKVGVLERTLSAVNSYLFSKVPDLERMKRPTRYSTYGDSSLGSNSATFKGAVSSLGGKKPAQRLAGKAKASGRGSSLDKGVETALKEVAELAQRLPRAWSTVGMHDRAQTRGTAAIGKIVVIGVHGWFTQSIFKNMIGEPTGTSAKFAAMQTESIRRHFLEAGLELNPEAITAISLQGDGKVADRVDRLFAELISRPKWVEDLKSADALFLSAHSQGAIVATQLLARLIEQRHVRAEHTRICLLAMCGIHHGPFAHLKSSITASYINYFETAAAKELFEFQSSTTAVAQQYTAALKIVLDAGTKCVYIGSTDDNVVPVYSALNLCNNHPSILRALYIDGQAFPRVDFLTNLLVLCVAVRNAGLSDHNLLTLLSASVAGSLYGGRGHSQVYEEKAVYDLATRYLFEVTHPLAEPTFAPGPPGATSSSLSTSTNPGKRPSTAESETSKAALVSEAFEAQRWNPYELPWALRGLFEDKHVRSLFAEDMLNLLESYEQWRPDPKSKALKDLQWRLAPMRSIKPPPIQDGEADAGASPIKAEEAAGGETGSSKNSKL